MKVVIIMGSKSDQEWSDKIKEELDKWQLKYDEYIMSAHKVPEKVHELIQELNQEQQIVWLAIAGRSNALSGVISAGSIHPVIACPPFKDKNDYLVNIHSSLQMPSDTPALTVLDSKNAAAACARIFGLVDLPLQKKIKLHIQEIKDSFK